MSQRRLIRTTQPELLAHHLHASITEIADYAHRVAELEDPRKQRAVLQSMYHMLQNTAIQVQEHADACEEAIECRELPAWDVAAHDERFVDERDALFEQQSKG